MTPVTSSSVPLSPMSEAARLTSVDVVRGVAVLGILLMNMVGMALPDPAYWDPSGYGGATGWNLYAWFSTNLLFEGTMRGMLSLVFGAGVLLFTAKGQEKEAGLSIADAWYRRTIWLFLFGVIHAYVLLWPGDILYAYGLMGMFLFPLRHVRPGRLFALGLVLLVAGAAAYALENHQAAQLYPLARAAEEAAQRGETPTDEQTEALEQWQIKVEQMQPDAETKRKIVTATQSGYASAFVTRAEFSFMMESYYHYRYSYFDVLSMMLIGMALFRWGVLQGARPARTYVLMMVAGYSIGLPVNWYESVTYLRENFSLVSYYRVSLTYDIGRLAMITGHLGLILLFCQSGTLIFLRRSVSAVGRMALTNYILQTIITTLVFVGWAQFGRWERHQLYYLVLGIWLFQLVASPLWLRRFYFGPLEWAWRSLTYVRRQPWVRRENQAPFGTGH